MILFIRCLNWVIFSFMKNKNTLLEEEWNLGEHAHIHQTATTLHLDLNMSSCAQCHQNNLEKSLCAGTNLQACDLQTLRQQSIKHRRDSVMEISPCTSRTRCPSRPVWWKALLSDRVLRSQSWEIQGSKKLGVPEGIGRVPGVRRMSGECCVEGEGDWMMQRSMFCHTWNCSWTMTEVKKRGRLEQAWQWRPHLQVKGHSYREETPCSLRDWGNVRNRSEVRWTHRWNSLTPPG